MPQTLPLPLMASRMNHGAMRYWTADPHFGHARILELCPNRPWGTVAAMNQGLIDLWNATVGIEDEVWIVGDFAMGPIHEGLQIASRLHGKKHLVPGNHDRCSTTYPHRKDRVEDWVQTYREAGFESVEAPGQVVIGGVVCQVNHFPYSSSEDTHYKSHYDVFRPQDDGLPLIHGHVHAAWKVRGRMVNVGLDAWDFRPAPENVLASLVQGL